MAQSPRRAWVVAHAHELASLASSFGASRMCMCGSVARGTDTDASDIDFYIWEFDGHASGTVGRMEARQRADDLLKAIRAMCPFDVDVRGLPGWPLDPEFEATMRRDSIALTELGA